MDDIQFWLYLVFGAIYLITRFLKKKGPEIRPSNPAPGASQPPRESRKPVTFEELLKEFTEGRHPEEEELEPVEATELIKEQKKEEERRPKEVFEEGRTRRFADDESRRIYEESIRKAEGAALEFKRDEHFKSKIERAADEEDGSDLAAEIKEMLQDKNQAQKAIVLGEILNRKY